MAVAALKEYVGTPRDTVSNYHGNQLVYVCWDQHLLFAAPFIMNVSPDMLFGELLAGPVSMLIKPDPDSAKVDWNQVEWLKGNKSWQPDPSRSLADNGIVHKDQLRFRTPGLNSLMPV